MKDENLPEEANHLSAESLAEYASQRNASTLSQEVEAHCIVCAECRARLAIALRVCHSEISAEEQRELKLLIEAGLDAATKARQRAMARDPEPAWNPQTATVHASGSLPPRFTDFPERSRRWAYFPPALTMTASVVILAALGLFGYWAWQKGHSQTEQAMETLRSAFPHSRPIEARLTGSFAHQPYETLRGPTDAAGANVEKLEYVELGLTREVKDHPTAEARQVLGRLYLLQAKFSEAEKQFSLALEANPQSAQLHADLGALYYERFKRADQTLPETPQLLIQATEHNQRALEINPKLLEARFNLALCNQRQGLRNVAQSDWEEYLKLDPHSAWAEEARAHLKELQEQEKRSAVSEQSIQKEFLAGDESTQRRLIKDSFDSVRKLALAPGQLFDQYLVAEIEGKTTQAQDLSQTLKQTAQFINEIHGDRLLFDAVTFAAHCDLARKKQLQEIRQNLLEGNNEIKHGQFSQALGYYKNARQEAERLGDRAHLALALFGMAQVHTSLTPSKEFFDLKARLVAESERQHYRQVQAQAMIALANTYATERKYAQSLALHLKAAELAMELGDIETAANAMRSVGHDYSYLGDHEKAIKKTYEAVTLVRDHPVSLQRAASVYFRMGDNLFRAGHYSASLPYQHEALRMYDKVGNTTVVAEGISQLSLTYSKLGRDQEAIAYLRDGVQRVEAIKDQIGSNLLKLDLYLRLGDMYQRQNNLTQAITTYQSAIAARTPTTNQNDLPELHHGLAMAYLKQGKEAEAENELNASIRMIEQDQARIGDARERSFFLTSRRNVYHAMADFQFTHRSKPILAFDYAEKAKSRDLLDALAGQNQWRWSDDRLTLMLQKSASPLRLEEIQRILPAHAQLAVYAVAEQQLLIWLVTHDTMTARRVPVSTEQLRHEVSAYLAELRASRSSGSEKLNQQAASLYNRLIKPLAEHLDSNRVLCIIPDDVLHFLPFSALVKPETGHFLIEDYSVTVNPSASVLAYTLKLASDKKPCGQELFLGLSNPDSSRQRLLGLPSLEAADQEINYATAFYSSRRVLSHKQASESALARQMGDAQIIHLATHTLINTQSPLLSSILLADEADGKPANEIIGPSVFDGQFRAYEICQQKLQQTRLVILSSCNSSLTATHSEALSSLAQAFFVAGAPSVIASLWEVDDGSTAKIMEAFHRQHHTEQGSFSLALRQAQCSFIHQADSQHRHPYYWAAFLLTGDGLTSP